MSAIPKPIEQEEVKVPAHLRHFVAVLGVDGAVDFLLKFGGGASYFSLTPDPRSPIATAIGVERATKLGQLLGAGTMRVPTGKPFIARVFRARGMRPSAIARRLHVTDVAVRGWLADDSRQMTLFDLPPPG